MILVGFVSLVLSRIAIIVQFKLQFVSNVFLIMVLTTTHAFLASPLVWIVIHGLQMWTVLHASKHIISMVLIVSLVLLVARTALTISHVIFVIQLTFSMLLRFVFCVHPHVLRFALSTQHFCYLNAFPVCQPNNIISILWSTADCPFVETHILSYFLAIMHSVILTMVVMTTAKFNPTSFVTSIITLAKQYVRTMAQSVSISFPSKGKQRTMNLLCSFMCFLHFTFSLSSNNCYWFSGSTIRMCMCSQCPSMK